MSQTERLFFITSRLKDRGSVTVKEICKEFEVTERSAKRDIEYLRDRCGCNIVYSQQKKKYISEGVVPDLSPSRNMIFYAFVNGLAKSLNLLPFFTNEIRNIIFPQLDSKHMKLADAIRYQFSSQGNFKEVILEVLFHAFKTGKVCTITYHKPDEELTVREIEPLRFINHDGQWYVMAYCHQSKGIRQFALVRINKVQFSDSDYSCKYSTSYIDRVLEKSFGIMKKDLVDDVSVLVKIKFYGNSAARIGEQVWHPSQVIEHETVNGIHSAVLTLPVESYDEIVRKVLFFGDEAEVLEPADFREIWIGFVKRMSDKFL